MLTKDDLKDIGLELGKVIEQNVTPALDEIHNDVKDVQTRLSIVEHKLDRALYHELDLHKRWIHQLADKVGVELERD